MNHAQNINYNCIQNSGDDHSEFHAICYNLLPIYTKKKKSPFNFHPLAIQAQGCKETKTQSSSYLLYMNFGVSDAKHVDPIMTKYCVHTHPSNLVKIS